MPHQILLKSILEIAKAGLVVGTETLNLVEAKPVRYKKESIELTWKAIEVAEEGVKNKDGGMKEQGTKLFLKAIDADPRNFQAHLYHAQMLYFRGLTAQALVAIGQAKMVAATPSDIKRALSYEGHLYGAMNDWQAALATFDSLASANLKDGTVRYNRAEALVMMKRRAEGIVELKSAFEIESDPEQRAKFVRDLRTNKNFETLITDPEVALLIAVYGRQLTGTERTFNPPTSFPRPEPQLGSLKRTLAQATKTVTIVGAVVTLLTAPIWSGSKSQNPTPADNKAPQEQVEKIPIDKRHASCGVGHGRTIEVQVSDLALPARSSLSASSYAKLLTSGGGQNGVGLPAFSLSGVGHG